MNSSSDNTPSSQGLDLAAVRRIVEPIAQVHGVRLVGIEWASSRVGHVLRVTIDRADELGVLIDAAGADALGYGIGIDDCVRVSRDISVALDVADPIERNYTLEVSSPGLDRPLRSAADFARHVGKLAKIKLSQPADDGQRVLRGIIEAVQAEQLQMNVDGKVHTVALSDVAEAKLVFDFGTPARAKSAGKLKKTRKKKDKRGFPNSAKRNVRGL